MLRKLTREEVLALEPSETLYWIALKRLWQPQPVLIEMGRMRLNIVRSKGRIVLITPVSVTDWAEGNQSDVESDGSVVVEDYAMEIFVGERD